MCQFVDGPAGGVYLNLRRAPLFLRAVRDAEEWNALDQLYDRAKPDEKIYAYVLVDPPSSYHLLVRGKGKKGGGWFQHGQYTLVHPQPPDDVMRDNTKWRAWTVEVRSQLAPSWAKKKVEV